MAKRQLLFTSGMSAHRRSLWLARLIAGQKTFLLWKVVVMVFGNWKSQCCLLVVTNTSFSLTIRHGSRILKTHFANRMGLTDLIVSWLLNRIDMIIQIAITIVGLYFSCGL